MFANSAIVVFGALRVKGPWYQLKSFNVLIDHLNFLNSMNLIYMDCYLSLFVRKPVFGFPTRSNTNQAVQIKEMDRGLKFRI